MTEHCDHECVCEWHNHMMDFDKPCVKQECSDDARKASDAQKQQGDYECERIIKLAWKGYLEDKITDMEFLSIFRKIRSIREVLNRPELHP